MRNHSAKIGDLELDMAVTFGVARDIKEKVADPMLIVNSVVAAQNFAASGLLHKLRFEFDVENVAQVIFIGAKPTHPELKLAEVQDACCDAGFFVARNVAAEFLARFVDNTSQEAKPEGGGKSAGE